MFPKHLNLTVFVLVFMLYPFMSEIFASDVLADLFKSKFSELGPRIDALKEELLKHGLQVHALENLEAETKKPDMNPSDVPYEYDRIERQISGRGEGEVALAVRKITQINLMDLIKDHIQNGNNNQEKIQKLQAQLTLAENMNPTSDELHSQTSEIYNNLRDIMYQ